MPPRRQGGRRTRPNRKLARRILVVTEGRLTERQYVEGLNSFLRDKGASTFVRPVAVGKDPLNVVRTCVRLRDEASEDGRDYHHCVCLVDVDQHDVLQAACQLAERESILLLISNLKFEVWLRWHVEAKRSALSSSQLDALMAELGLLVNKHVVRNFPFESVDHACQIARQADPNMAARKMGPDPSSALPILVDLMQGR